MSGNDAGQSSQDASSTPSSDPRTVASAWQPFTPRGLVAFSRAGSGRVLILLWTVGLILAGTVVWFLNMAWFPAIRAAVHELPAQGQISHRELSTPRVSSHPLAEHRFLGFVVLVHDNGSTDLTSHIAVKFRKKDYEICSIFGCWRLDYPADWTIEFNRPELEPRWAAWEPILGGAAAILSFFGLLVLWMLLGFVYSFIPTIWAALKKRDLSWPASYRLCLAAQMPGALLMVIAIWSYGLGLLDVLQFLVLAVVHLVMTWAYIGFSFSFLPPRHGTSRASNPFALSREAADPSSPTVEKP